MTVLQVLANSKDAGVEFEDGPWSINYDPTEEALVASQGNGLIFLDPTTLKLKNKIYLEDDEKARGVGKR